MKLLFQFSILTLLGLLLSCNNDQQSKSISPSGYEYIHHIKNDGPKPQVGDQVTFHNVVFQNDTTLLSSTFYKLEPQTAVLPPKDKVPVPTPPDYEVLFLMSVGDSLTVFQDLDTFPANQLPSGVTNEDKFSYHLKLLAIKPKAEIEKEQAALRAREQTVTDSTKVLIEQYLKGKLDDQLQTTESGLKYIIHKEGNGEKVKDGGFAKVHYAGFLMDGTPFDNSFKKALPLPVRIGRGQVIAGWDEGIPLLSVGSQATFFIPYTLAYGVAGKPPTIPEKADLVFFVELAQIY
jgi:FKBP-type peptidyl-prolyl cis-trans isomerase